MNAAKVAEVVIANAGQTLAANIGDTSPSDRESFTTCYAEELLILQKQSSQ